MRSIRKAAALMLAVVLLTAAFGSGALASAFQVKKLKTGTWYKFTYQYDFDQTLYRLKLTKDAIITVSVKGNTEGDTNVLLIYRDKARTQLVSRTYLEDTKISYKRGLKKGTYYFLFASFAEKPAARIRITAADCANKPNYCPSKAITLKPGKKVTVVQLPTDNYYRWYRIKLSTERSITIRVNTDKTFGESNAGKWINNISLYTKDLMRSTGYGDGSSKDAKTGVWETAVLPAGTYYLLVRDTTPTSLFNPYAFQEETGDVITFSWR